MLEFFRFRINIYMYAFFLLNFFNNYIDKIYEFFQNFLSNTKEDVREAGSFLFSIISTYIMNDDSLSDVVRNLMTKVETKCIESQHGAILSLGHIIERKITKTLEDGQNFQDVIRNWEFLVLVVTALCKYFHFQSRHKISFVFSSSYKIILSLLQQNIWKILTPFSFRLLVQHSVKYRNLCRFLYQMNLKMVYPRKS